MLNRICVHSVISSFSIIFCLVFAHQMPIQAEAAAPRATSTTVEAYQFAVEVLEFPMGVKPFETMLEVDSRLTRVVGTDGFIIYAISNKLIAEGLVGIIAHKDPNDGRIIDASVFFYSDSLRTRFIAEPLFASRGFLNDVATRRKQELKLQFRKSEMTAISFAEALLNHSSP